MLKKAKYLKIRRIVSNYQTLIKIKFYVIDVKKHQTYRKNFNFIKKIQYFVSLI